MSTSSTNLSTRYGRRHTPRRVWVIVAVVLIAAGVAWSWWASQAASDEPVSAEVHSFDVRSDHSTQVTLQVHRNESGAATCEVYAQALDHGVVGERTVKVAPSDNDLVTVTSRITTDRRAVNVQIRTCRMSG